MSQLRDYHTPDADAEAAQRILEGCLEPWGEGESPPALPLVLGLAAVAICERLNAVAVRIEFAIREAHAR